MYDRALVLNNLYSETTQEKWSLTAGGLKVQVLLGCLRRVVVLEQWSLKAGGLLIQVICNTGLTIYVKLYLFQQNSKKGKHCFEVRTPEKTYLFAAETEAEMEDWIKVLDKVRTAAETLSQLSFDRGKGEKLSFLTLFQTTNFRLFQTGRVCRRQFRI